MSAGSISTLRISDPLGYSVMDQTACATLSALHTPLCKSRWLLVTLVEPFPPEPWRWSQFYLKFLCREGLGQKGSKDLGSREPLVVGDEAAVGSSWGADGSGSYQGSTVKGTQMGGWWKSFVSSLCNCTTVRQLMLPVKASLPRPV